MKFYNVATIHLKQVSFGNSFIICGLDILLFPPSILFIHLFSKLAQESG